MSATHQREQAETCVNRNYWCDCLRGYAILLVCVSHMFFVDPIAAWNTYIPHFKGDTGVFIFYVLSGFLVTGILEREMSLQQTPGAKARAATNFFARRFFRLQPTYFAFLACYMLLPRRADGLSWWSLVFPISNWSSGPYITWHLKTLHVEELYYAFVGVVSMFLWHRFRSLMWFLVVVGPVGRVLLFVMARHSNATAEYLSNTYIPIEAFAAGGLLSLYRDRIRATRANAILTTRPGATFVASLVAMIACSYLRNVRPFSFALVLTWPLVYSALSVVMIVSGLEDPRPRWSARWLRQLGLVSYTVYLFQQYVLGPWRDTFQSEHRWSAWLGLFAAIVLLIPLWYAYIEKPLTMLGSRLFPRLGHGRVASPRLALRLGPDDGAAGAESSGNAEFQSGGSA